MEHHHPTERPNGREQEARPADHTPEIADPPATGASEEPNAISEAIAAGIQAAERSEQEIDEPTARAIASRLGESAGRVNSALQRFATTGSADPAEMRSELLAIHADARTASATRSWIDWLGTYLIDTQRKEQLGQTTSRASALVAEPEPSQEVPRLAMEGRTDDPAPTSPHQQVKHYLHLSFQEADRLGRPIDHEVARAAATLLAATVPPPSALHRFAESGQPEVESVRTECRQLVIRTTLSADRLELARRLDHYLAALDAAGVEADDEFANKQRSEHGTERTVAEGIRQHGDAFRAFLELPDTDRGHSGLLDDFVATYVTAFESMDTLIEGLTEIRYWQTALDEFADQHGLHGLVSIDRAAVARFADEVWDIVRLNGRLYVFNK